MTTSTARVERLPNGMLILIDPFAMELIQAFRCLNLLRANDERLSHFARRIVERGDDPSAIVIVVLDMDDPCGSALGETLMPGHDWQAYRVRGEAPVARGLAQRPGVLKAAELLTQGVQASVLGLPSDHVPVVVVTCGYALIAGVPLPKKGN